MRFFSVRNQAILLILLTLANGIDAGVSKAWAVKHKAPQAKPQTKPIVVFDEASVIPTTQPVSLQQDIFPSTPSREEAKAIPKPRPAVQIEAATTKPNKTASPRPASKTVIHATVEAKTSRANTKLLQKAQAFEAKHKPEKALKAYQQYLRKAPQAQDKVAVLVRAGRMADQVGKYDLAEKLYRQAYTLNPDHHALAASVGLMASRQGHSQSAVDLYRKALATTPNDTPTLGNLGVEYMKLAEPMNAIQSLYQAAKQDPENPDRLNVLGKAFLQANMPEEAIKAFQEAIRLRPDRLGYHQNLAEAYKRNNMIDQAIAEYHQALTGQKLAQPDTRDEKFNQARIYYRRGLYKLAITYYYKALRHCETRDERAQVFLGLGFTYEKLDKAGKAKQAFQEYLTLLPTGAAANEAKRHVAMLAER